MGALKSASLETGGQAETIENKKQAKGNECSQYKSIAAVLSKVICQSCVSL
jgi:hypothetical protein